MVIPHFVLNMFKSTPNCPDPKCASCQIDLAMKRNPDVMNQDIIPGKEAFMLWDKYEVVFFSVDKLIVKTSDNFTSGYVREGSYLIFHGGIFLGMRKLT